MLYDTLWSESTTCHDDKNIPVLHVLCRQGQWKAITFDTDKDMGHLWCECVYPLYEYGV